MRERSGSSVCAWRVCCCHLSFSTGASYAHILIITDTAYKFCQWHFCCGENHVLSAAVPQGLSIFQQPELNTQQQALAAALHSSCEAYQPVCERHCIISVCCCISNSRDQSAYQHVALAAFGDMVAFAASATSGWLGVVWAVLELLQLALGYQAPQLQCIIGGQAACSAGQVLHDGGACML